MAILFHNVNEASTVRERSFITRHVFERYYYIYYCHPACDIWRKMRKAINMIGSETNFYGILFSQISDQNFDNCLSSLHCLCKAEYYNSYLRAGP